MDANETDVPAAEKLVLYEPQQEQHQEEQQDKQLLLLTQIQHDQPQHEADHLSTSTTTQEKQDPNASIAANQEPLTLEHLPSYYSADLETEQQRCKQEYHRQRLRQQQLDWIIQKDDSSIVKERGQDGEEEQDSGSSRDRGYSYPFSRSLSNSVYQNESTSKRWSCFNVRQTGEEILPDLKSRYDGLEIPVQDSMGGLVYSNDAEFTSLFEGQAALERHSQQIHESSQSQSHSYSYQHQHQNQQQFHHQQLQQFLQLQSQHEQLEQQQQHQQQSSHSQSESLSQLQQRQLQEEENAQQTQQPLQPCIQNQNAIFRNSKLEKKVKGPKKPAVSVDKPKKSKEL